MAGYAWRLRLVGSRVYDGANLAYPVRREAALLGVLADHVLTRDDVGAVDLVFRNLALNPLICGPLSLSTLQEVCESSRNSSWDILPAPGTSRSITYLGILSSTS